MMRSGNALNAPDCNEEIIKSNTSGQASDLFCSLELILMFLMAIKIADKIIKLMISTVTKLINL